MTDQELEQLISMSRQDQLDPPTRLSTHELLCKMVLELKQNQLEMDRVNTQLFWRVYISLFLSQVAILIVIWHSKL